MAGKLLGASFKARMLKARAARYVRFTARLEWLGKQLEKKVSWGMATRLKVAGQLLRDKIVLNISYPVEKVKTRIKSRFNDDTGEIYNSRGTRVVPGSRSKPGGFPHADTTLLMKTVYWVVNDAALQAKIGTPLDYGLILETRMNRSFLVRTWYEMRTYVLSVLLKGGNSIFVDYASGPSQG